MKTSILLPLFAATFIILGDGTVRAGDTVASEASKKPIVRKVATEVRTAPVKPPVVRRDSRPLASGVVEVRIARTRPAAAWSPGAPGD